MRPLARLAHGIARDRPALDVTRKQPGLGAPGPPVGAQFLQQPGRERDIAVLVPLTWSTRSIIRWLSMSVTFRCVASDTRNPAA